MNTENRKKMYISVLALIIAIVGLSVAYAALSTTLNINFGDVTQNTLSWSVGFEGSTAEGEASGTGATGRTCGTATITSSSVNLATTTISKPGDKCTYSLTIKNSGTIDANLSSITPKNPNSISCETSTGSTMVCGNITYKLTTDKEGTTPLDNTESLAIGGSLPVYLVVSYNVVQSGAAFALSFAQA